MQDPEEYYETDDGDILEDEYRQELENNENNSETRLWENDSSYLVAVAPRVFENRRIQLKVILGYRVQSLVHGVPSIEDEEAYSGGSLLNLPHSQRRFNRYDERLHVQDESRGRGPRRAPPMGGGSGGGVEAMESMGRWAMEQVDAVGWRGVFGVIAFVLGAYRALSNVTRRPRRSQYRFD
eukprot:gb/GECH01002298.1/.p1 GENE.gb/GECH01002298.1/~~gb/GECH01002298.1/.p1  ORF type:complete len:181 (+),score=64.78 gb/GECH01002298.1/:1-543(+)